MSKKFEEGKILNKEKLDELRNIEGFPLGEDKDIIALSAPPYYTACPNPFINDFIEEFGTPYDEETDTYHREPFAADVSEGKYDPLYKLHSYHTKVPHKAIMRYILHYTEPGDIVFDGFCGTGMTGVAAQMCGNPEVDLDFKYQIKKEMPGIKWGARNAILSDLSPAATFIAYNYNSPIDVMEFEKEANRILDKCEKELGWMYETNHVDNSGNDANNFIGKLKGTINYVAWSDVFYCPNCGHEIVFWDTAVDKERGKINKLFNCKQCKSELKKQDCSIAKQLIYDPKLKQGKKIAKQVPVFINYTYNGKRYEKIPDEKDLELLKKIESLDIPYWYPTDKLPAGDNTDQPKKSHGLTNTYDFYTRRNLAVLSMYYDLIGNSKTFLFALTKVANQITKQYRLTYMNNNWGAGGGPMSGTLYVSSLNKELNMLKFLRQAIKGQHVRNHNTILNTMITTQSSTELLEINDNTIDYIFTDPPFGGNLNYSELSFIWESWLRVKTNNESEAIMNKTQKKHLPEYSQLMDKCFDEFYRILKPNRWITIEFHNSHNAIWNSIQESIMKAGFIVADVRTLDKKHNSLKQVTTTSAVKQDLIISAYKPKKSLNEEIIKLMGSEETVWLFIREHLEKLPVIVHNRNNLEIVKEREGFLLFDRMVAYHIVNGISIPIDASDFYKGLEERFIKRENMYFLQNQVNEYDNARIKFDLLDVQFDMFVDDEKSARAWLYYQLETPQTYSELQPKFMKEAKPARHEKMPELIDLLHENFLQDDEEKWYIPDITKSGDIQKLREKKLLKEFEEYLNSKGKLRNFRTEAVRVGFAKLWKEKNYELIVKMGDRIPENVLQEDDKLLMYYDISSSRID